MLTQSIAIYPDRVSAFIAIIGSTFFLYALLCLLCSSSREYKFNPPRYTYSSSWAFYKARLSSLCGTIITTFFAFVLLFFAITYIRPLFQINPELVISKQGIEINSLGFVDWNQIDKIYVETMVKGRRGPMHFKDGHSLKLVLQNNSHWLPTINTLLGLSTFEKPNIIYVSSKINACQKELNKIFAQATPAHIKLYLPLGIDPYTRQTHVLHKAYFNS